MDPDSAKNGDQGKQQGGLHTFQQKMPIVENDAEIESLPETYRNVLLLRDIEDLDTEETARIMGISAGAVKTRLHRARQALRGLLEPHMAESSS